MVKVYVVTENDAYVATIRLGDDLATAPAQRALIREVREAAATAARIERDGPPVLPPGQHRASRR